MLSTSTALSEQTYLVSGRKSPHPLIPVRFHKRIIVQMRVGSVHTVDLCHLPETERLMLIQAPEAFEQALAAEDFVEAGDAAVEAIRGVEEGGVAVGDFDAELQQ